MSKLLLPAHPTMRYPAWHSLAGEAVRALHVDKHGRAHYPLMGGAPDDPPAPNPPAPTDPPTDPPAPTPKPPAPKPADPDLGFPKDTPIAEMTAEQQAAYWKHQSRKHESTWKDLVGDRRVDDVKNDLAEAERIRQEKLTPSEKAIQDAEQRGRQAARQESSTAAAKAILRANLEARGIEDTDDDQALTDLVESINVDRFIENGDIDTTKISNFAKRFGTAGTAEDPKQRVRNWGAGPRRDGETVRGAGGKAEAKRRFGDKTTTGV